MTFAIVMVFISIIICLYLSYINHKNILILDKRTRLQSIQNQVILETFQEAIQSSLEKNEKDKS